MKTKTLGQAVFLGSFAVFLLAVVAFPAPSASAHPTAFRAALIFAALFGLGHLALVRLDEVPAWTYRLLGSLAVPAACLLAWDSAFRERMMNPFDLVRMLSVPAALGFWLGSLYPPKAAKGDDPERLALALSASARAGSFGRRSTQGSNALVSADTAYVDTGISAYYSGPVQVRTSLPALLGAAYLGAFVFSLNILSGTLSGMLGRLIDPTSNQPRNLFQRGLSLTHGAIPSLGKDLGAIGLFFETLRMLAEIVSGLMLGAMPLLVVIYICHVVSRWRGKADYIGYAATGLVLPPLFFLVFLWSPLGFTLAVPTTIAMLFYRRLAGLEPKDLPEDIHVTDSRTLIGADHPRRRYQRIADQNKAFGKADAKSKM